MSFTWFMKVWIYSVTALIVVLRKGEDYDHANPGARQEHGYKSLNGKICFLNSLVRNVAAFNYTDICLFVLAGCRRLVPAFYCTKLQQVEGSRSDKVKYNSTRVV